MAKNKTKTFNIGKVKLTMSENGFPKGLILKRDLTLRECRHIMLDLLGIDILNSEDFDFAEDYNDYRETMVSDVNKWLRGETIDEVIAEYAYDCATDQLGLHNMIPIIAYLLKKGII